MKKMRGVGIVLACFGALVAQGQVAVQTSSQTAAKAAGSVPAKRAMTFADLMAMKRVSDPQISPSGKWVMFSVTDVSLGKNTKVNHLWVVALEDSGGTNAGILSSGQNDKQSGERQVTFGDGESNGRFSPDGKWVSISVKDQIYLAPWNEAAGRVGAAVQLTHVSGGADGAVWSPDSRKLMFVAGVYPECSVRGGTKANAGVLRSAQNDNPNSVEVSGTRDVAGWKGAEPAGWAEEDACDKAKDEIGR